MQLDFLWPGGPRFAQREPVFKLGTDAVLLAHFTNTARVKQAVDLGCGAGILPVLLAGRTPGLQIDCVDILPEAVALTKENADYNGLTARVRPRLGDIRQVSAMFPAGGYDLIVSNPPYFPTGSGKRASGDALADARDEAACTLDDLCSAAAYLLRWGGRFSLVHRPERLSEIFVTMARHGIEPKRLRMVALTAKSAPNLVLVEGRRGGNPGLTIEAPLFLQDETGADSPEVRAIYRMDF
ncbi:MAG: methyltransferase [Oscillospiraceae bacterium]|nr:methyltransferase [Oscillospiraceae bacterium]